MRRTLLLGTVVLVLAASACTKTRAGDTSVDVGDGLPVSAQFLADTGAKSCSEVTSGHLDVSFSASGSSMSANAAMTGDFDTAARQSDLTLDLGAVTGGSAAAGSGDAGSGLGQLGQGLADLLGGKAEVVTDGDTAYINWSFLSSMAGGGTPWVKISATGAAAKDITGQMSPIDGTSSCDVMDLLRGAGGEVTEVGPDTAGGVDTTHYRATIDLTNVAGQVPADRQAEIDKALQKFGGATQVPVDVWIDSDGIARRVAVSYGGAESKGSVTMTTELSQVNEPVSITIPPADQVTEFDLGQLFGGLGTGGAGLGGGTGLGGEGPN